MHTLSVASPLTSTAPYTARLGAALIDMAVYLPFVWITACSFAFVLTCSSTTALRLLAVPLVLLVAYCIVPEWRTGRTVGKVLFGLRVQRTDGAPINLGQAILHRLTWVGPLVGYPWFISVDGLLVLLTPRRQRLGDLIGDTIVVAAPTIWSEERRWVGRAMASVSAAIFVVFGAWPLIRVFVH